MTELGLILKRTCDRIYSPVAMTLPLKEKANAALKLDEDLVKWRFQINPVFDLEATSLTEREAVTKKKMVIKLRKGCERITDMLY